MAVLKYGMEEKGKVLTKKQKIVRALRSISDHHKDIMMIDLYNALPSAIKNRVPPRSKKRFEQILKRI